MLRRWQLSLAVIEDLLEREYSAVSKREIDNLDAPNEERQLDTQSGKPLEIPGDGRNECTS